MGSGAACECPRWNHRTWTPHTSGTAERAGKRVTEGTCAVLEQSGLDEVKWNVIVVCATIKICLVGQLRMGANLMSTSVRPFRSKLSIVPQLLQTARLHQFGKESPPRHFYAPVLEEDVQCPRCEKWFGSVGTLRSRAVRTHGWRDQLRLFVRRFFRPEHVHFTMHDTLRGVVSSGF